jgi:hypothetical protein
VVSSVSGSLPSSMSVLFQTESQLNLKRPHSNSNIIAVLPKRVEHVSYEWTDEPISYKSLLPKHPAWDKLLRDDDDDDNNRTGRTKTVMYSSYTLSWCYYYYVYHIIPFYHRMKSLKHIHLGLLHLCTIYCF